MATDISDDALAIAGENAKRHQVDDRISLKKADQLNGVEADDARFDAIVSNPPYIATEEFDSLDANVRDYEPRTALTDESDGLSFYQGLARHAAPLLGDQGFVAVEVADQAAEQVSGVFAASGWSNQGTWCDRVTGHERVLVFTI